MLPTLTEFLEDPRMMHSAYIKHSRFSSIYVRRSQRYIGGQKYITFELANLTAEKPGDGAFKELISELKWKLLVYGVDVIYVESVMTEQFASGLERLGFVRDTFTYPPCYMLYL